MKFFLSVRRTAVTALLAGCFMTFASIGTAQSVPTMTIEIHNNSDTYNIYPVLSTGGHLVDTWMQAAFQIPQAKLADYSYPTPNTFRFYLNPYRRWHFAPHGSITVTLPLYTQLVPSDQVNPKLNDQYIDWWNGGRISIYASPVSTGAPPKALVADYTARPSQKLLSPVANAAVPTCPACQQPLQLFEDTDGELPSNDPSQLIEYTLGAIDMKADPYTLDVKNVDYDVSYVDNVYLPAAMEPYNNPVVGWIGTIQDIDSFKRRSPKISGRAVVYRLAAVCGQPGGNAAQDSIRSAYHAGSDEPSTHRAALGPGGKYEGSLESLHHRRNRADLHRDPRCA